MNEEMVYAEEAIKTMVEEVNATLTVKTIKLIVNLMHSNVPICDEFEQTLYDMFKKTMEIAPPNTSFEVIYGSVINEFKLHLISLSEKLTDDELF